MHHLGPNPGDTRASIIYFTECQLATVEKMESVKRTSASDLRRQRAIADGMGCGRTSAAGNKL